MTVGLALLELHLSDARSLKEKRMVINRLKDGAFTLPLDNGAQIQVAITVNASSRSAVVDFTGTSPQQTNNFNAPTQRRRRGGRTGGFSS